MVDEAIVDAGPPLHLQEINRLEALRIFHALVLPEKVRVELARRGLPVSIIEDLGIACRAVPVEPMVWQQAQKEAEAFSIQEADAQVFALAEAGSFSNLILSDDLALRRLLEGRGATVVGSVGILIRAYGHRLFSRDELNHAIEDLSSRSSLHLSVPFRAYLKTLLRDLPRH